jgi:two pore calcium channel protein, plant
LDVIKQNRERRRDSGVASSPEKDHSFSMAPSKGGDQSGAKPRAGSWLDLKDDDSIFTMVETEKNAGGGSGCRQKLQLILFSTKHNALTVSVNIISLFQFVMIEYILDQELESYALSLWIIFAVVVNALFLIELVLNIVAFGPFWIVTEKKVLILELFLQGVCIYAVTLLLSSNYYYNLRGVELCSIVSLLRMLRLLYLISEIRQFDLILAIFLKFQTPFFTMCLSLYTVYFAFAELGMLLFAGAITTESAQKDNPAIPALYYLMNFNDFLSSMVTLFHIMVVNNWYITCDMLCTVKGNSWPIFFFVSFWILTVLIMLNIVIAFVLEIYSSVQGEIDRKYKITEYRAQI